MESLGRILRGVKNFGLPDEHQQAFLRDDLLLSSPEKNLGGKNRLPISISISPVLPTENHDGATIDLGLHYVVEGDNQPIELSTQVVVEKGRPFTIRNTTRTIIFDSRAPNPNPSPQK